MEMIDTAHEIWAAAQLAPGEGIEDGAGRIASLLTEVRKQDTALIRQLVEALDGSIAITMVKIDLRNAALTAARARLEDKP